MKSIRGTSNLLPLRSVNINDKFWSPYRKLMKEVVLPYQWDVLNDRVPGAEPSHTIKNLRIAAGLEEGEYYGFFFQDTDLAKWLEAVAYSLQTDPDKDLEKIADEAIDLVGEAQEPDGYFNSYFQVKAKGKRWTNLYECHELYTLGHFIEAGVAYYEATGKRKLLDIVCKFADYADTVFGPEEGKLKGYDSHQEIELALVRLYRVTGEERYLRLSKFFIDERGREPFYFDEEWEKRGRKSEWNIPASKSPGENREYNQTHLPVREQKVAVGHAVRMAYMLTGMAEVAKEYRDEELLEACRTIWNNIVTKQMYITGGIGSTSIGEAFTFDYDLPNDTIYAETCASIGLIVFAQRMLLIENKRTYSDYIEKALFNIIAGSMSKDGKHYFYVNPLEVWPEASEKNPVKFHVKPVRQKWFGCACCPPNLARLITSLQQYIYTVGDRTLYVHQYIGGEMKADINNSQVILKQESNYPWDGSITIQIYPETEMEFDISLRIPGWCKRQNLQINGNDICIDDLIKDGYVCIRRVWKYGDVIALNLDMPAEIMETNPLVRANAGKVTIQRGPVVYCLEETDNGTNLSDLKLKVDKELKAVYDKELPGGAVAIYAEGLRRSSEGWEGELYRAYESKTYPVVIKAVPYYLWGNRNPGEMLVWLHNY